MKLTVFKNKIVKNAGWLIAGKVAQMLVSLVVGMLTARYLGPSNYGLIGYAQAYTSFFMAFCTLGINSVLVREIIDNPESEGRIIGSTLVMRAVSSFLSAIMIVGIVSLLESDEPTTILVTALCSISLFFNIFETFNYWFQSKLKSKITAIASLIAYVATAAYKIVLLILGKSVAWFAFAYSLDYICVGIILLICYKHEGGQKLAFSKTDSKRILSRSIHFILPSLMVSIYRHSDEFMLKQFLNETEVGYYTMAVALSGMLGFVFSAIIDSVYPSIMEAHKENNIPLFEKRNKQLYAIVFYLANIISLFICIFAPFIIRILYGKAYLPAVMPLRVITWYTAFSFLGVARDAWVVCENKQKYLKYIYIGAALCNVVLNLIFIPLWGATGAAFTSLITQIAVVMIFPLFIRDLRPNLILILEAICLKNIK